MTNFSLVFLPRYDMIRPSKESSNEPTAAKKYFKSQEVNAMVHYAVGDILKEDNNKRLTHIQ